MKHESVCLSITGALLGFGISLGAAGCLATAFTLEILPVTTLALILGAVCLVCGILFLWSRGGLAAAGLAAIAAFVLWQKTDIVPQIQSLLCRITSVYHSAYGWPVLFPEAGGSTEIPLLIWSCLIAGITVHTVCRRKGLGELLLLTLLPLFSCLVVTDTVPQTQWLFWLIASFTLLILTNSVRRENAAQSVRLTATMALPVILALAVLFRLAPQDNYVNYAKPLCQSLAVRIQSIPEHLEGQLNQAMAQFPRKETRQVDLSALGARIPMGYPVLDITCDRSGSVYLRYQDYDRYDGLGWTSTRNRSEIYPAPEGSLWTATIRTHASQNALFLPGYPREEVTLTGGMADNGESLTEYTLSCIRLPEDWRITAYTPATDDPAFSRYLELPEDTRQTVLPLLEGLYDPLGSNTEKADAIAALVSASAAYHLSPGMMPQDQADFAVWFLEDSGRGYCVHFATAATVLLRAAGIPARYVSGYLAEVTAGQTLTVTEENAHAWAEYYEPNLNCWLVLESTPGETTAVSTEATEPATESTEPALTEAPATTEAELPRETAPVPQFPHEEDLISPEEPEGMPGWVRIPAILLGMVLILVLQRCIRITLRRRRFRQGSPNWQALQRWQETERLSRILKEPPPEELLSLARKARFSQHTLTTEELTVFDDHLRHCRHRMEKQPLPRRLINKYIHAAF